MEFRARAGGGRRHNSCRSDHAEDRHEGEAERHIEDRRHDQHERAKLLLAQHVQDELGRAHRLARQKADGEHENHEEYGGELRAEQSQQRLADLQVGNRGDD